MRRTEALSTEWYTREGQAHSERDARPSRPREERERISARREEVDSRRWKEGRREKSYQVSKRDVEVEQLRLAGVSLTLEQPGRAIKQHRRRVILQEGIEGALELPPRETVLP